MENDFGKSALHFAAISDRAPVIALLCAKGAEVNKPDIDGNTALHRACDWKSQEASKELIKYGADITIANKVQNSIVASCCFSLFIVNFLYSCCLLNQVSGDSFEVRLNCQKSLFAKRFSRVYC
jgi:ankyrin repeat protein